jgi:hypothetical protein
MRRLKFLRTRRGRALFAAAAILAVSVAGCAPLREFISPAAPPVTGEWAALLDEIRSFERRIGFDATANFTDVVNDQAAYPFCGHASRLVLPWSYEDPAIRWYSADSESDCRAIAPEDDIYFRRLEAKGESETPITGAMLAGKLDRFIYLVIHEDCHDQFALPYGVEEALCDLVTHKAMITFAAQKYSFGSREQRSIRRYAINQAELVRATIAWHGRLEALYARYQRGEVAADALLRDRATMFGSAEQPLGFRKGELNNVSLASNMTYSRYYPLLEEVYDAQTGDLARTVAFFRQVDLAKPPPALVQGQKQIADTGSVEFLRAYESAIIDAVRAAVPGGLSKPF